MHYVSTLGSPDGEFCISLISTWLTDYSVTEEGCPVKQVTFKINFGSLSQLVVT